MNELSIDEQIYNLLKQYGVDKPLYIEHEEDKPLVLMALQQTDIECVSVDDEGILDITYTGNEYE